MNQERGNGVVKGIAERLGLRTQRNEDGELVVRVVGRAGGSWPSEHAHAGMWGKGRMYLYAPSSRPRRRVVMAQGRWPGLVDRGGDSEVLLVGSVEEVCGLLTAGPSWARGRKRRVVSAGRAEHLRGTRFVAKG